MDGLRTRQGLGRHFAQRQMAHITHFDHVGDGADRLLDGYGGVEARRAIDVDVIGAETLETIAEEILHGGRPRVEAAEAAIGRAQRAELDAEDGARLPPFSASRISISLWPMP